MRLCLLCCLPLLTACLKSPDPVVVAPRIPADLLKPCSGYTGPVPQSEGQISDALIAEARGRACANGRLATVGKILAKM